MVRENKIIIKLYEEFKNDRVYSQNRVYEILNFLKDKKIINGKYNDYSISISWDGHDKNSDDWSDNFYKATIYIEHSFKENEENVDEGFEITTELKLTGGQLVRDEDQLSPAEYADTEEIFDHDNMEIKYWKYYDSLVNDVNDIDHIDVDPTIEINNLIEEIILANLF